MNAALGALTEVRQTPRASELVGQVTVEYTLVLLPVAYGLVSVVVDAYVR